MRKISGARWSELVPVRINSEEIGGLPVIGREFENKLADLIRKFAPKPIVKIGDVVSTNWGPTIKPRDVKITSIHAHIVSVNRFIGTREQGETLYNYNLRRHAWCGVDLGYYAVRLNSDGQSKERDGRQIVLDEFTTKAGGQWKAIHPWIHVPGATVVIAEER